MSLSATKRRPWREPWAIDWRHAGFFLAVHAIAMLAFFPSLFSWTGVLLCIITNYAVGLLGINVGYHRLFTHRSFSCPIWVERTLAILGSCCGQDAPTFWVAVHRRHHHRSDDALDPHSPQFGFFWGHMGWLVLKRDDLDRGPLMDRYAKDLRRDPFQAWLVKHDNWIFIMFASWVAIFIVGFGVGDVVEANAAKAAQFGLSLVVWGAAVRTVIVWHVTWIVNSANHLWGYRNYNTPDNSRNSVWLGVLCSGEGWHNNHHADPRSAQHGHKWWEFDPAWVVIRMMRTLGLAHDVRLPSPLLATRFSSARAAPALEDFVPPETESRDIALPLGA